MVKHTICPPGYARGVYPSGFTKNVFEGKRGIVALGDSLLNARQERAIPQVAPKKGKVSR
jgi:hypothetical protein